MQHDLKEQLLSEAIDRIDHVQATIYEESAKTSERFDRYRKQKDPVAQKLAMHFADRIDELHHLLPSPFFVRCDVADQKGERRTLYFSKHQLIEESIFSWTSPAARLRFADIGQVEYAVNDGKVWKGSLDRKDQFLINDGKIIFMTSESRDYSRTLVHQEELMKRKAGFILPEIVERMERAQDDVVRAHYQGSFLIAGPAGSGKTTLAFHRIAYLLQSPDTALHFSQDNMIVFVQDDATKAYFSQLLPELGIHHVLVTTFSAWGFERLGLTNYSYIRRANGIDSGDDAYEMHKLLALRDALLHEGKYTKDVFLTLRTLYNKYFTDQDWVKFDDQVSLQGLDRIDLTFLLKLKLSHEREFSYQQEYFEQLKNFEVRRKSTTAPLRYAFIALDEIQNYLPEQVSLIRSCIDNKTGAMLYVGDLGQRVLIGTMNDWSEVGESFPMGRRVELDKVYRSTKQILEYIRDVGFHVLVPNELRPGTPVIERVMSSPEDEMNFVKTDIIAEKSEIQIGILGFSENELLPYRQAFANNKRVHVLTVHQAQGVEFERVYIIGLREGMFGTDQGNMPGRSRIQRDLVYVAVTRAMDTLIVVGSVRLRDVVKQLS